MKPLFFLIPIFTLFFNADSALADIGELEKRLASVVVLKQQITEVNDRTLTLKKELETYAHPHAFEDEKKWVQSQVKQIESFENTFSSFLGFVSTQYGITAKKIEELKSNEASVADYDSKKKELGVLKKTPGQTARLTKYFQFVDEVKPNLAEGIFLTLNAEEKKIASRYQELNHTIQSNLIPYEEWKKNILDLNKAVSNGLKLMEESYAEATPFLGESEKIRIPFEDLKKRHSLKQVKLDLGYDSTKLGGFDCSEDYQPHYLMPKILQDVMLLKTGSTVNAAIRLDPTSKLGFTLLGSLRKYNEKRMLCQLDPTCDESLKKSESTYDRLKFFNVVKAQLIRDPIEEIRKKYQDQSYVEYREFSFGYFSKSEIGSSIDQLSIELQKIDCKDPADCHSKIDAKISESKNKLMKVIETRSAADPKKDSSKKLDSERILTSIFENKVRRGYRVLFNSPDFDMPVQDAANMKCEDHSQPPEWAEFCAHSKSWRSRLSVLEQAVEVENLNKNPCFQAIFRLPDEVSKKPEDCEPKGQLEELKKTVDQGMQKLKN